MTMKKGKKVVPLQDLLREADELYRDRTMAFAETEQILSGYQLEEFLDLAAKEIRLRSELVDREIVKVGKTLFSVKQRTKRGEFRDWVQKSCPFSYRTAQNYISLFKVTLDRPELLCLNKSTLYLIGAEHFPEALREYLSSTLVGVYDLRHQDVLKLQTEYLNGDIDLNDDSFTENLKKKEQDGLHQLCAADWQRIITKLENEKKTVQSRIDRQKKIGGASYNNKFRKLWRATISILDRASSDISSLARGDSAAPVHEKRLIKSTKTPQDEPIWDPPDQVFDEMKKMRFERQAPDDLIPIMSEEQAAELLKEKRFKELAPEDLTPIGQ